MSSFRKSPRLPGFDYTSNRRYFITTVVQNRERSFGYVDPSDNTMHRNELGEIVHQQILWLESQFPYVFIHEFVVMPNHIHVVIEIDSSINPVKQKIKPLDGLIGALKTTSSKQIHLLGNIGFKWQRSFHDHIIRNDIEYRKIIKYIKNNPANWFKDRFKKR